MVDGFGESGMAGELLYHTFVSSPLEVTRVFFRHIYWFRKSNTEKDTQGLRQIFVLPSKSTPLSNC